MQIPFVKMHGLGNDFVMLEKCDVSSVTDLKSFARQVSNRRLALGCDQMILYHRCSPQDYTMDIYNADGSKAEACGNATRCLAWLAWERFQETEMQIKVAQRRVTCKVHEGSKVSANMGPVLFDANWMPPTDRLWQLARMYKLSPRGIMCADVGNPHLVIFCNTLSQQEHNSLGQRLSTDAMFKEGVNVNFAVPKSNLIELVVWERGTGLSLSCGSGACATFASAHKLGFSNDSCLVRFQLGELEMKLNGKDVIMTGPVTKVASGTYSCQ